MLTRKGRLLSLSLLGSMVALATGCAAPPRVLINADGQTTRCAMLGYGIAGASMAQTGNNNCVADARALGFLPLEETGAVGVVLDDQDNVATRLSVVVRGSPAEAAGLKVGDVVTAINGQPVPTKRAAQYQLFGRIGEGMELLVRRGDREMKFALVRVSRTSIYQR